MKRTVLSQKSKKIIFLIGLFFESISMCMGVGLTPDQLAMAKQLSPQEQRKIAEQMGVTLPRQSRTAKNKKLAIPEVVRKNTDHKTAGMTRVAKLSFLEQSVLKRLKNSPGKNKNLQNGPVDNWKRSNQVKLTPKLTPKPAQKAILQFGYELFEGSPSTFAPVTEIPVPSEYTLGPGDELSLQFYGKKNHSLQIILDRSGLAEIPEIGPILLRGLSFRRAKAIIAGKVRKKMIGVTLSVTMGQLRSIRVFVLGDANHPGSYMVSSLSTISNALFVAGGISKKGSMRAVQLKRKGKVISTLDMYDFLLRGDSSRDYHLLAGDVIFIGPIGKSIAVSGEVNRPAIYEFKYEKTVSEIVTMAGGLTPTADHSHQQLDRITEQGDRILIDLKPVLDSAIQSGDILIIHGAPATQENQIELLGEVKRPGKYGFFEGMSLKDILPARSELLASAHTGMILIQRRDPKDASISVVRVALADLFAKKTKPWPVLQAADKVYVFPQESIEPMGHVQVTGELVMPGTYPLGNNMKLLSLVLAAGGPTDRAYLKNIEITRYKVIEGIKRAPERINIDLSKIIAGDEKENISLQAYDEVTIRKISQWGHQEQVSIKGEVTFPGEYAIISGEHLSSVLKRAGGFSPKAYLPGAIFVRESIRKEQQDKIDASAAQLEVEISNIEESIATLNNPILMKHKQNGLVAAKRVLKQLQSTKAVGRLVIDLKNLSELTTSEFDLLLSDGDSIVIPEKPDQVLVLGQVFNTTALVYRKSYTLDDYLERAGGVTRMADENRIHVMRANGIMQQANSWGSTDIYPGDSIIVPEELEQFNLLDSTLDWSQVLFQIGVGAASLRTVGIL